MGGGGGGGGVTESRVILEGGQVGVQGDLGGGTSRGREVGGGGGGSELDARVSYRGRVRAGCQGEL